MRPLTYPFLGEPQALAGRKRKRPSPTSDGDSPLSEQSESEEILQDALVNGGLERLSQPRDHAIVDAVGDERDEHMEPPSNRETPEPAEIDENENPYISPMKAARLKRAKQKSKRLKEPVQKPGSMIDEDEAVEAEDVQDDEESSARSEEDREYPLRCNRRE